MEQNYLGWNQNEPNEIHQIMGGFLPLEKILDHVVGRVQPPITGHQKVTSEDLKSVHGG